MKRVIRNPLAIGAHLRPGAGPHRDSRKGKGGSRNDQADLLDEYEVMKTETSGSIANVDVIEP